MNEYTDDILRGLERVSAMKTPKWMHAVARIGHMTIDGDAHWQRHFEAPFDAHLRDQMVELSRDLKLRFPDTGKCHIYRDELTLQLGSKLLAKETLQSIASMMASQISAGLTLRLGKLTTFQCSIVLLPTASLVEDYFNNLMDVTEDRTIELYATWLLRMNGHKAKEAAALVDKMTRNQARAVMEKYGYLPERLPIWQRLGLTEDFTPEEIKAINIMK